jgi:hypothetical protein
MMKFHMPSDAEMIKNADDYAGLCTLERILINNGHDPKAVADVLLGVIKYLKEHHLG